MHQMVPNSAVLLLSWTGMQCSGFYVPAKAMVMGDLLRIMQDSIYRPSTCRAVVASIAAFYTAALHAGFTARWLSNFS
jgi:hypothetical protein